MASAPTMAEVKADQQLDELRKEIQCSVCNQQFCDPKLLPCLHYFCKECIQALAGKSIEPFPCPKCTRDIIVPRDNPDCFPEAPFIEQLIDLHEKMSKVKGRLEAICGMCSGSAKAKAFCHQCSEFICMDCSKSHRKMKVFAEHEVKTIEELLSVEALTMEQFLMREESLPMCKEHEDKLKLMCFNCNRAICHECVVSRDHVGHTLELVGTAVVQCRKRLEEGTNPLLKIRSDIDEAKKGVAAVKAEVTEQGASIEESIKLAFSKLHKVLDRYQQEMLDKSSALVQQKLKVLEEQGQDLESAIEEAKGLCHFIERNLAYTRDEDLIALHGRILIEVGHTCQKHAERDLRVRERANVSLEVPSTDNLLDLCRMNADVFLDLPADPAKCTVTGPGTKVAEVDKPTSVLIHTARVDGQPCRGNQHVAIELKSLVDGSVIHAKGTPKLSQLGVYEVSYCPKVRGRHQLTPIVNGAAVSPSQVFVKFHPSKIRRPVHVTGGLWKPWSIAVDAQRNEILVSELGSNHVKVMDKSCNKLTTTGCQAPTGVARDEESCTYVIQNGESLMKYGQDGALIKVEKGKLWEASSVRVFNGSVYVCDCGNHRIAVFSRELHLIRTLGCEGTRNGQFRHPQDIAQDKKGNLYVSDKRNRRIQVFNREGNFQRSFGSDHLVAPTGLCLSPDEFHLYVVDSRKGCVTIFTSSGGKLVSSFSRHGRSEGELNNPVGIAVDGDGFVYVCDHGNDRIQVF